jgi:hypothetical protein
MAKQDDGIRALRETATNGATDRTRAAAIAALASVDAIDEPLAKQLLADTSSDVRQLAARVVPQKSLDWTHIALNDPSLEVRAAAMSNPRPSN